MHGRRSISALLFIGLSQCAALRLSPISGYISGRFCASVQPRSPVPVAFADELISKLCDHPTDEKRQAALKAAFQSWPVEEAQGNTDTFVDSLSAKVNSVQQAALQAHGRGEDTSDAELQLWKMVDMVVQVKVLMKALREATSGPPEAPAVEPGESSRPKETRIRFDK